MRINTSNRKLRIIFQLAVIIFIFSINVIFVHADGTLSIDVNAVDPDTGAAPSGAVLTGDIIEYVIDFSCSSTTGTCGDLTINFPLDSEVVFVDVISPPSYTASYISGTSTVNIVSNDAFDDGEAGQVTVRVRVGQDLSNRQIDATIEGTITNGAGGGTQSITVPGSPITIAQPSGGWDTSKSQTVPANNLGPAEDGTASYSVSACPADPALGVARLTEISFVDRFPPGATPSNISNGGVASDELDANGLEAGDPGFIGLDGVLDTIRWTIQFSPDPHTADDGCVAVTYDLTYPTTNTPPTPNFSTGTAITNTYSISAQTPDTPFPANGDCPNCVGTGNAGSSIAPPSVTVASSKTGPGAAVIAPAAPGNIQGITPFTISWNLAEANAPTSNFIVQDVFPSALNTTPARPVFDVAFIQSGTWSNGEPANIQYLDAGGTWNTINPAPIDGSSNVQYSSPADFPLTIYGVRWVFQTDVPAGFRNGGNSVIWINVPTGLDPAAYGTPANPAQYQNCATFSGVYDLNGVPTVITANDACTNFLVGEDNTNGFANITSSKTANPGEVFPTQDITFTLRVDLTQEASGALVNPFIEDQLPYGMQITEITNVQFNNYDTASGDTNPQPLPYVRVERVANGGTNPLTSNPADIQRLLFFWSDTAPGASPAATDAAIFACTAYPCTVDTDISNFDLTGSAPVTNAGSAANPLTITAPGQNTSKSIIITFTAQARVDTPAGDNSGTSIPYDNGISVVTDSVNLVCQSGNSSTDTDDIDGDSITTNDIRCDNTGRYFVREAAQIAGTKWIRSFSSDPAMTGDIYDFRDSRNVDNTSPTCETLNYTSGLTGGASFTTGGDTYTLPARQPGQNASFTRFPCVAQGRSGEPLEYLIRLQNTGLANVNEFILYDIFPHETDFGVSQAIERQQRESEFRTFLIGPIDLDNTTAIPAGLTFEVEYFVGLPDLTSAYNATAGDLGQNTTNPYNSYRPQMTSTFDDPANPVDWSTSGSTDAEWRSEAFITGNNIDWRRITSFRIRQTGGSIVPGQIIIFSAPAIISAEDDTTSPTVLDEAQTGEIAWNSFSHRYTNDFSDRRLLTAAPRKVGIIVDERYSVGNRVWLDDGRTGAGTYNATQFDDGFLNGAELGINGVIVDLYQSVGGGNYTRYASDITRTGDNGDEGYYFFGNLPGGNDINYVVHIPYINFLTSGWTGTTYNGAGTDPGPLAGYISSHYTGGNNQQNSFNRNQTTARQDSRDNGRNPANSDYTLTTFLGNGLPAGGVSTRDFSLTRSNQSTQDSDVNTINTNPGDFPVNGSPVDPTNEGQFGRGVNFEADDFSDLTRDFGFYAPMSIGNRIWLDDGGEAAGTYTALDKNNGEFDPASGETPIAGVTVELYRDNGDNVYGAGDTLVNLLNEATGNFDVPARIQTDASGYYIFVGVPPGNYFVRIPEGEFFVQGLDAGYNAGNPTLDGTLAFHVSSTGWTTQQPNSIADNLDNGQDTTALRASGITSTRITLTPGAETTNDADKEDDGTAANQPDEADGYLQGQAIEAVNSDLTVDFGFLLPPMSIGNVVWRDGNNNGVRDGIGTGTVEPGIAGVRVNLYRDSDNNGVPDDVNPAGDDVLAFTTTDTNGYYLFDGFVSTFNGDVSGADRDLPAGRYIVEIDPSNFNSGNPLFNSFSSDDPATIGDDNTDSNDDGIGTDANYAYDGGAGTARLITSTALLVPHSEPTGETDASGVTPAHGSSLTTYGISTTGANTGSTNIADDQSDRTWDFGFYQKFSVGNRVWYDMDNSNGAVRPGDGRITATAGGTDDAGAPGVVIDLFEDTDGNNVFSGGDTRIARTTTDANGYYLFDETNTVTPGTTTDDPNNRPIAAGNYIVHIPASEFAIGEPLYQYYSSDGGGIADGATEWDDPDQVDNDIDTDDNGVNQAAPATTGVSSQRFTLSYAGEPETDGSGSTAVISSAEGDFNPSPTDRDGDGIDADDDVYGVGVLDINNNMTIDFAFYRAMSIGNRVWFDRDRSGTINTNYLGINENTTGGIDNVRMFLFRSDASGAALTPDGSTAGSFTTNTDAPGNGIPDDAIAVTTTANGGYYLFDSWITGGVDAGGAEQLLQPGYYVVVVDPAEFNAGAELENYISTITNVQVNGAPDAANSDNQRDNDDNGVDTEDNNGLLRTDVKSAAILLTFNGEASPANPADDTDLDATIPATTPTNSEGTGIKDENGEMTVDFGFFIPYALGNRVWLDDPATASPQIHPDSDGDGLPDGPEATAGIGGVQLSLFLVPSGYTPGGSPIDASGATVSFITDGNSDGIPDGAFATTLTNASGYYIFDYLPEGNYVVQVDPINFNADTGMTTNTGGALYDATGMFPYFSSEDTNPSFIVPNHDVDLRDDGVDENNPQANGVRSNRYTLFTDSNTGDAEPAPTNLPDDLDRDAIGEGTNGELDENANMTVDFEFNAAVPMSIGNRVFYDYNNNGVFDGSDAGIPGVIVRLYSVDAAGNVVGGGQIDDPNDAVAQVTTGANGEYIFDGLQRGTYRVVLAEANFRAGALLDNYQSTTNITGRFADGNGDSADTTTPGFENGGSVTAGSEADNLTPENQGIISPIITLTPITEPQNETFKFDTDSPVDGIPDDGQPNVEDSNGDMTQDFGVYKPISVGNRVWFDTNNDGIISTGESGVAGVTVSLYVDEGNGIYDGTEALAQIADIGTRTVVPAQEQTDANGYYLFDNVPPGQYFVVIEDTNFNAGQPLAGVSSTVTGADNPAFTPPAGFNNPANDDSNDNGVDTPVGGDIHSELIDLTRPYDDLITTEPDRSGNAANDGPSNIGRNGETDNNSDITIDFGFTSPNMSLGNRVWYDEDGNGLIDASNRFGNDERAGIDGVNVSLYRDNNSDGVPDGAAIALDTTSNGGYYLFENLAPGNYVVGIDNGNFTAGNPLEGLISTLTTADNIPDDPTVDPNAAGTFTNPADDDSNDNGGDTVNATYGVLSNTVVLTRDLERSGEGDLEPGTGNGTGVDADDSDLTVDFGFFEPMSLGNRVWLDNDDSGLIDNGEVGVTGVTVYLFRTDGTGNIIDTDGDGVGSTTDDTDGNNIPDDAIATDVTDAGGYYLFDGLPPGTYVVAVDAQAFNTGQPLAGTASSSVNGDPATDSDDDGIALDGNNNVLSAEITLNTRDSGVDEPTGETDTSNDAGDGANRRGTNGETDANSNLAVDFGFTPTAFYSIGNRVWLDNGGGTPANARNGFFDAGETGIQGVTVSLYRDADGNDIPDGAAIATTNTDANGYYLFDSLATGTYIVGLNRGNFTTGVLQGYASTVANADNGGGTPQAQDNNDNRNNPAVGSALDPTYGFYSSGYTLDGTEPTTETSPDNLTGTPDDAGSDPAGNTIADANSDLTIDFGVYRSMTIGNRVWFDLNNNGFADATENGIAGVELVLFRDSNTDGIPDDIDGSTTFGDNGDILLDNAGNPYTDVTDSLGYYLFNNLAPGSYIVAVRDTNFTAGNTLEGFASSTGTFVTPVDRSDNGVDTPTNGHIISATVTLTQDAAPTGETDNSGNSADGPNFRGVNNENDNNSDLTWDFGFFSQPMSLGNRVWLDDGGGTPANAGNGEIDTGENGIQGVLMELFADTNSDGAPDGARIATDTTDANGYYLFDGLAPGNYVVRIAASNFNTGNALDGLFSTTTINTADTDSNDNGIDNNNPETTGILSETIVLEATSAEPTGESDLSNDAGDDDGSGNYRGANGEADEDSNLTVDFGFRTSFDWGDAPDTYGTDATDGGEGVGPSHRIITQLRLGNTIDDEAEGFPVVDVDNPPNDPANGDDTDGTDDEDGLTFPGLIVPETTFDLEASVFNNTGQPANLVVWFDWDGDGIFEVSSDVNGDGNTTPEAYTAVVPSSATQQTITIAVTVPAEADIATDGTTYVRARLTTDAITTAEPTGAKNDGEIEDYELTVDPPGVFISKSDGANAIVAGQSTTYTVIVENSTSAPDLSNQNFTDNVPVANPNGFEPASVSWTCTATNGASCLAGSNVTSRTSVDSANNPWQINELVDLPAGGRLEYTITATLRAAATGVGGITIDNTASVSGVSDTDSNSIVFDPPRGTKTGTLLGNNVIRWQMVWFNSGDGDPATNNRQLVTISDTIQAPQTFLGNLDCLTFDSDPANNGAGGVGTETISCTEAGGTVTWTGYIDEDFGTPGGDNRLIISFDVTIPAGNGVYNNVAVLDDGNAATANVTAGTSVVVQNNAQVNPPDAAIEIADPVIVKLVDPLLALPDEDVVWTISVTNPNSITLNDIVVTDDIPLELDIISASASFGSPTISGQTVRYEVQSLLPDQTVTVTIVTRIRESVTAEQIINIAILENTQGTAEATVFPIYDLPETGENPWWRSWFTIGIAGAFSLLVLRYAAYRGWLARA